MKNVLTQHQTLLFVTENNFNDIPLHRKLKQLEMFLADVQTPVNNVITSLQEVGPSAAFPGQSHYS